MVMPAGTNPPTHRRQHNLAKSQVKTGELEFKAIFMTLKYADFYCNLLESFQDFK
jgi:hypothetical protein